MMAEMEVMVIVIKMKKERYLESYNLIIIYTEIKDMDGFWKIWKLLNMELNKF